MQTPGTRAKALQGQVTRADDVLVGLARRRHPMVGWWFGVRRTDGVMGAYCYVCDSVIVAGALNVGITDAQRSAVNEHRAGHWGEIRAAREGGK